MARSGASTSKSPGPRSNRPDSLVSSTGSSVDGAQVPLPAAFVTAERFGDRGPTMVVSPHLSHLTLGEGVAGDDGAGPANLEAGAVDGSADLDELAQHLRWHRTADAIDADGRQDGVDPTSLDVVGVETDPRQRRQKLQLDLCSLGRRRRTDTN